MSGYAPRPWLVGSWAPAERRRCVECGEEFPGPDLDEDGYCEECRREVDAPRRAA